MSTGERIAVPARSRALLERMIEQRDRISAQIDAVLEGVRTALDVPEGWQIVGLDQGFTPPSAPPLQSNGAQEEEVEEGDPAPR